MPFLRQAGLLWIAATLGVTSALSGASPAVVRLPGHGLTDVQGHVVSPLDWGRSKAIVVFFMMTDCPLSNAYVPELNRIAAEYQKHGVAVYAAHSDPTVSDAQVRKHAEEFGYAFTVLLDHKLDLARSAGARVTPTVAVLSRSGQVLYLGRIDNRAEDITRRRSVVTEHELRDALDAVISGRAPKVAATRAVGCSINVEGIR